MELIIDDFLISAPMEDIVTKIRIESGNKYFNLIGNANDTNLPVQCPFHKDGKENHISASFFINKDDPKIYYGTFYCFTCHTTLPLYKVVGHCLELDDQRSKDWLLNRFSDVLLEIPLKLPDSLEDNKNQEKKSFLDPTILNHYNYYNDYLETRKISKDIMQRFKVGFDKDINAVTFPCWDTKGNLTAINKRCIDRKHFILQGNTQKDIYLLNFILADILKGKNYPYILVCESQINALYAWSLGIPAIALMGTGTRYQYNILKESGLQCFVLCFDGDDAGRHGAYKFKQQFKNCFIIDIKMPNGKDLNDLDKNSVQALFLRYNIHI